MSVIRNWNLAKPHPRVAMTLNLLSVCVVKVVNFWYLFSERSESLADEVYKLAKKHNIKTVKRSNNASASGYDIFIKYIVFYYEIQLKYCQYTDVYR
jgi:hypothetical protein